MRIHLNSVFVDDQKVALEFYTDVLGFEQKHDIALGDTCGNLIQILAEK